MKGPIGVAILVVAFASCVPRDDIPTSIDAARAKQEPPPATVSSNSCTPSGGVLPVSDPSSQFDCRALPASTTVDATSARFLVADPETNAYFPTVLVGGGSNIVWSGGAILGQYAPSYYYDSDIENGTFVHGMHDKYGMLPGHDASATGILIQNVTIFDYGDGISFDHADAMNWTIRGVHIKYSRDDCVEDDAYQSGTIDDSFLDGCYSGVSARACDDLSDPNCHPFLLDGSSNLITVKNSLVRLQSYDVVYKENPDHSDGNKVGPKHNAFWKWNVTHGPMLALNDNTFRADGPSEGHDNLSDYMEPVPGKLVAGCSGNVLDWFGDPNNPPAMGSCFTVYTSNTTPTASDHWNGKVAAWNAAHPAPSDVAKPIVSIFPPPDYWTEPVPATTRMKPLVATAVDDRAVTNVKFNIDGNAVVTGVQAAVSGDATAENGYAGPTKYRYTWDSQCASNGPHQLTATAWDGNNPEVTSTPSVTITVNNPPIVVSTVSVAPATTTVNVGQTVAYTATPKDQSGAVIPCPKTAAWSSTNTSVATVAQTGNLLATATAVGGGTTTIRATIDGVSGNATLTVPPALAPPTNCVLRWIPAPSKILEVTWTNSGQPNVLTEVWYSYSSWTLDGTASPGATLWDKHPGPGQNGVWGARVRHVKAGSTPSDYCVTNTLYISGL